MSDATPNPKADFKKKLELLKLLPQYALSYGWSSYLAHQLTHMKMGKATHWLVRQFVKVYGIDMSIAQPSAVEDYATFNEFFTRALDPAARPLAASGVLSPADGVISQIGQIQGDTLLQAKGHDFTLDELFGGFERLAGLFENGAYCTIYLSPKDYHRVHMPLTARPIDMVYVPGRRFSVNAFTAANLPKLYARNERVVNLFRSEAGAMALVMVAATFVGGVETVWEGPVIPSTLKKAEHWRTSDATPVLERGDEAGRFNMGSTVILLFEARRVAWLPSLQPGTPVQMGQQIGTLPQKPLKIRK